MGAKTRTDRAGRGPAAAAAGIAALLAAFQAGDMAARAQPDTVALPDPTNKILIARPETVRAGGRLEIVSAIENKGAGPFTPAHSTATAPPALSVHFLLVGNVKDASGTYLGAWGLTALEVREVKRMTTVWTVPRSVAPGRRFLCADVDPGDKVRESNEHNNRTCRLLEIEAPEAPEAPESGDKAPEPESGADEPPGDSGPGGGGPAHGEAPGNGGAPDSGPSGAASPPPEA